MVAAPCQWPGGPWAASVATSHSSECTSGRGTALGATAPPWRSLKSAAEGSFAMRSQHNTVWLTTWQKRAYWALTALPTRLTPPVARYCSPCGKTLQDVLASALGLIPHGGMFAVGAAPCPLRDSWRRMLRLSGHECAPVRVRAGVAPSIVPKVVVMAWVVVICLYPSVVPCGVLPFVVRSRGVMLV